MQWQWFGVALAFVALACQGEGKLASGFSASACGEDAWAPPPELSAVPVHANCAITAGDVARTFLQPPAVYYCPAVVRDIEAKWPGAWQFYFAHEFGHIAQRAAAEQVADCWAARELAGTCYINAAVQHFLDRSQHCLPGYGCGTDRAVRIARCATTWLPYP